MANKKYRPVYPAYNDRYFKDLLELEQFYTNLNSDKIEIDNILDEPMNLASDKKVRKLQTLLKRFGFNVQGNIPGVMDATTTEAVKSFKNARVNEYNEDLVSIEIPNPAQAKDPLTYLKENR